MQPARFELHAKEHTSNPVQRPNFRGLGTPTDYQSPRSRKSSQGRQLKGDPGGGFATDGEGHQPICTVFICTSLLFAVFSTGMLWLPAPLEAAAAPAIPLIDVFLFSAWMLQEPAQP